LGIIPAAIVQYQTGDEEQKILLQAAKENLHQ
jgi:hypothetical protein